MNAGQVIIAICIVIAAFLLITLAEKLLARMFGAHKWTYRNPSTRTCKVCDRQEDEFCRQYEQGRSPGWWEAMRPGNKGHRCSEKDAK